MSGFDTNFTFAAGTVSAVIAVCALIQRNRTIAMWNFLGGMLLLSAGSFCDGLLLASTDEAGAARWGRISQFVSIPIPAVWLAFSLSYSRGNPKEFLLKWRYILAAAVVLPLGIVLWTGLPVDVKRVESGTAWWLPFGKSLGAINLIALFVYVLALSNLEKTLRAAAGTVQWRIKFGILGVGVIFAAHIYTASQGMLYSGRSSDLFVAEALALVLGCVLLVVAYARRGFTDLDVYPSRAVLQSSVTILLVGGYLVAVGILAQALAFLGAGHVFRAQAALVLFATVVLGALLLSDRLRLRIRQSITRHFSRPVHDYREVWTKLTHCLSAVLDQRELCERSAHLIASTFDVLSVDIWIAAPARQGLVLGASTTGLNGEVNLGNEAETKLPSFQEVRNSRPVNLDDKAPLWAQGLQALGGSQFPNGGGRTCVPLIANEEVIGAILLSDRVDGHPYELDEFDMLQCIGDQIAAAILRIRMTAELMQSKELEAFQTMSAFFVHDLKNAASSLSLTLENLAVHYNDPEFRTDAFRGIGKTVGRIHQLIARLSTLRNQLDLRPTEVDLNELVMQAFQQLQPEDVACVTHELGALPKVKADPDQLQSVINNLLLNARDAVQGKGRIRVQTCTKDGHAILCIEDDGCGMSAQFVRDSLFRPFQSTKKNGLGIGMFQSRQIIKAHSGSIDVETELGHGTRFRVILPAAPPQS